MQYITLLGLICVFLISSIQGMVVPALKELAEKAILERPELQEQVKENFPPRLNEDLGYRFCKNHLKESWITIPQELRLQEPSQDKMRGVSFLGSSFVAVSVSANGVLSWWQTFPYPTCIRSISTEQTNVTGFSVSPDGTLMATADEKSVKLWRCDTQNESFLYAVNHDEPVYSVSCTPKRLIVGGTRGKVWVWNIEKVAARKVSIICTMVHERLPDRLKALNKIHALHITNDGLTCVTVLKRSIKVWDAIEGELKKEFQLDCSAMISKVYFVDDMEMISCFTDGTIILTHLPDGGMQKIKLTDDLLASCIPSADGRFLLTGTREAALHLWERTNDGGETKYVPVQKFMGSNVITQVAFRFDGAEVLVGNNSGELRLWGLNNQLTLDEAKKALGLNVPKEATEKPK